jgi:hypothetical protein
MVANRKKKKDLSDLQNYPWILKTSMIPERLQQVLREDQTTQRASNFLRDHHKNQSCLLL